MATLSLGGGLGTTCTQPEVPTCNTITVTKVLNGYIVTVGCSQVVFESKKKMLSEISRYFENPQKVTDEYQKKEVE